MRPGTTLVFFHDSVDGPRYALVGLIWTLLGTTVSMTAVLLNDVATKRYMTGADLPRLVAVALFENYGYRQLNTWWGVVGTFQALTGRDGWGRMKRTAFKNAA